MIPTIETITEDLAAGRINIAQANAWLHQRDNALAKQVPQWLPIADGLPKPGVPVLCLTRRIYTPGATTVEQNQVNPAGTGFYVEYDDSDNPLEVVTHWQPLPLPPTPQGETS